MFSVARKPVRRLSGVLGVGLMGLAVTSSPVSYQDVVALSGQGSLTDRWRASIVSNPTRTSYKNDAGKTVYARRLIFDKKTMLPINGLSILGENEFIGAVLAPTPEIAKFLSSGPETPIGRKADRFLTRQEERIALAQAQKQDRPSQAKVLANKDAGAKTLSQPLPSAVSEEPKVEPPLVLAKKRDVESVQTQQQVALDATITGSIADSRASYASNDAVKDPKTVFEAVIGETNPSALHPETPLSAPFDETVVVPLPSIKPEVVEGAEPRKKHDKKKKLHFWAYFKLPNSTFKKNQQRCLAAAIYFEARGEVDKGQAAVAQVVLNRVKNPTYPNTICGVVYQNKHKRNRCQFSFACDGIYDRINDKKAWAKAVKIAEDVSKGRTYLKKVGDSTHYHATYVNPRWARKMKVVDRIGVHIFYRTKKGGWI